MIAFVTGTVARLELTSAVLDVGGVGLELMCTPRTLADLRQGQRATLPTSMVVREDSLTLFGFAEDDEKQTFELLLTASGVGPKLAQAMLAVHSPDELRCAPNSLTADYLAGRKRTAPPTSGKRVAADGERIRLAGVSEHNLKYS